MVKITYVFNDDAIRQAGTSKDELLKNIRDFVAHRDGAEEPEYGVFTLDKDENDLELMFTVTDELRDHPQIWSFFKGVYSDVDGETDECINVLKNFKVR